MAEKKKLPALYLLPSHLDEQGDPSLLPPVLLTTIHKLSYFVVEDLRSARRFLKSLDRDIDIDSLNFQLLNEHTSDEEAARLIRPLSEGHDLGLLSEAGLPCVADPGARLVSLAHHGGYPVRPLPGPSSIYLALMASGFNGQNFIFHGYLPVDKNKRTQKIREMESDAARNDRTQIFIEAPYRNNQLMASLAQTCRDHTQLCVASSLGTEHEMIMVKPVSSWRFRMPDLHKKPAVFLIYA